MVNGTAFSAKNVSCGENPVDLDAEWLIAAYTRGTSYPHYSRGIPVIAFFIRFLENFTILSAIPLVHGAKGLVVMS